MATENKPRVNFASVQNPYPYPDFLDLQLKSFRDFLQLDTPPEERKNDGLYKVFVENFPITDTRNNFVLEFLDYYIDPPRYTIDECLERGLTYSVPLKAKMKLYCTDPDHEDFGTFIQDVFLGTIPYMTSNGTFVINGAERVVVSQLHRSPGVFFGQGVHANGTLLYSARIIPFKGSWIEFATDINNVMYAYIDRKKKLPVTTMLRAIGFESDKDILQIFDLCEEMKVNKKNMKAAIGRKLAGNVMKSWNEDFVDEDTGEVVSIERNEVVVERETEITEDNVGEILESGVSSILLHKDEDAANKYSIIFNTLAKDPSHSEIEAVNYIYRQLRNADAADDASAREVFQNLFFSDKRYDLGEVGRYRINRKLGLDTDMEVRVLTKDDIIEIIKYLINLVNSNATVDDIDHLSNRRVRTVGEQLANQFSIGLARMSRTIRERMNVRDNEVFQPTDLINAKTISSVINSFFGTNPLSQFMDQTNPLAEVTHKRRLSALGPGGLSRERAGFEVRDVHYTHYGRLCPIESPEGPNIGLISSLCLYAKINDLGFIVTPYRKVTDAKVDLDNNHVVYMTAEEEEDLPVGQGNAPLNPDGTFKSVRILGQDYKGRALLDRVDQLIRTAYFKTGEQEEVEYAHDYIWYLWGGKDSPLFDKSKMATFERAFIEEAETHKEEKGAYYTLREQEEICDKILDEFGVTGMHRHIINGHVPVRSNQGENPIKANGKMLVIDGGFSRPYHLETGIAGYTLVYHSRGFQLVQHEPFESRAKAIEEGLDIKSTTIVVELSSHRQMVKDTDKGADLQSQIKDLEKLLYAYRNGLIKEKERMER